jgi:hypothetical protein
MEAVWVDMLQWPRQHKEQRIPRLVPLLIPRIPRRTESGTGVWKIHIQAQVLCSLIDGFFDGEVMSSSPLAGG